MMQTTAQPTAAAMAFDRLATAYDTTFTNSSIGRAQRQAVWECAQQVFTPCSHLLELNCGTGEDAIHFAKQGFHITACDVSMAMITEARRKAADTCTSDRIRFHVQATEAINDVPHHQLFGGVFSNFSGLNCVNDLHQLAASLAPLLLPGAPLLLCFSTRYCLWEIAWYLLHGDSSRAFRRVCGYHEAKLHGVTVPVYYPRCEQIKKSFAPGFRLLSIYGVGITVPPSYIEPLISRYPRLLGMFQDVDAVIRKSIGLRVLGDHMLLHFERLTV